MVAGLSFIEAPLKFRAPNVTLQIGLGIGRLVFRVLNRTEIVLAGIIAVVLLRGGQPAGVIVSYAVAFAALIIQLLVVRPRLNHRSDQVLAGPAGPDTGRSHGHLVYVGFELVKVAALGVAGFLLLSS